MYLSSQNSFQINATMINIEDIIFEADIFVGHTTYNVRSIYMREGELTAYSVNDERFGLMFSGISYYEAHGFLGYSLLLDSTRNKNRMLLALCNEILYIGKFIKILIIFSAKR